MFNLSQLSSSETVLKCELYISKKHIKQRLLLDVHYLLSSHESTGSSSSSSSSSSSANSSSSSMWPAGDVIGYEHERQLSTQIDLGNLRIDKYSLLRTNNWHSFNLIDSLRPFVEARRANHLATRDSGEFSRTAAAAARVENAGGELLLVIDAAANRVSSPSRSSRGPGKSASSSSSSTLDFSNPYLMIYSKEQDTPMKQFFQVRPAQVKIFSRFIL